VSPTAVKGLIGFPSYHAVMALIAMRFAWNMGWARWPLLALNLLVLVSVPVEGGHHLVDLLAAFPVAWASLALSRRRVPAEIGVMVNKARHLTVTAPQNAVFRA